MLNLNVQIERGRVVGGDDFDDNVVMIATLILRAQIPDASDDRFDKTLGMYSRRLAKAIEPEDAATQIAEIEQSWRERRRWKLLFDVPELNF